MREGGYRRLIEGVVRVGGPPRALRRVRGADRLGWLQGQTTQDVAQLAPGAVAEACLCEATGQVRAAVSLLVEASQVSVSSAAAKAHILTDLAEETVFMEDVQVVDCPEFIWSVSLAGPLANGFIKELGLSEEEGVMVPTWRFGGGGDLFFSETAHRAIDALGEIPELSAAEVEAVKIEFGVPDEERELSRRLLPPELGPNFDRRHIHYQKGCYTGQEVLMRIHARGHTNRTWVGLILESPVEHDDPVSAGTREKAGFVTSCAVSPEFGPIAAALLHNECAHSGVEVRVNTALGDVKGIVRQLPLRD